MRHLVAIKRTQIPFLLVKYALVKKTKINTLRQNEDSLELSLSEMIHG